jgi:hypothetical protein
MNTRMLRLTVLALLCCASTACSLLGDRRDAPWDPKPGHSLIDQIPNNSSQDVCCGMSRVCKAHQTPRCN